MPADVQTRPSLMKIESLSTRTAACLRCNSAALRQWVVTRRPSNKPHCARTKAPVHTLARRLTFDDASWIAPISGDLIVQRAPPTTRSVSKDRRLSAHVSTDMPKLLLTEHPATDTICMR